MTDGEKSYCQRCDYETNHKVIHSLRKTLEEDVDIYTEYLIIECMGCENVSFKEIFTNLEDPVQDEEGEWHPDITETIYPAKCIVPEPHQKTFLLPPKIQSIYLEAIKAFNSECYILTAVAFRAVIEAICIKENVKGYRLENKINNLVKQKLITEKEAERLHSIRFLGNDSIHEMIAPKDYTLRIVLDIIDHLLNNLYLFDYSCSFGLETVIKNYNEFESILSSLLRRLNIGDEYPLSKILDKCMRRLNDKAADFETELIRRIKSGEYTQLALGKFDVFEDGQKKKQHYIVKKQVSPNIRETTELMF